MYLFIFLFQCLYFVLREKGTLILGLRKVRSHMAMQLGSDYFMSPFMLVLPQTIILFCYCKYSRVLWGEGGGPL